MFIDYTNDTMLLKGDKMNRLQQCEKRYANLKGLWLKEIEMNKELLEALEMAYHELDEIDKHTEATVYSQTFEQIKQAIVKAKAIK